MKGKGKGKGILIALIVLVFILGIGVYVGGYWAQRATKEILGMAQIYYVDLSVAGVIDYAFYDPVGLTVMVITDLLLLFVAARIFMQRKRFNGGKIDKERNFRISPTGTYGTADWMSEEEIRAVFDVGTIDELLGTVFGAIQEKRNALADLIWKREFQLVATKLSKHPDNTNTFIIGPPGRGKTRSYIMPHILQSVKRGESLILTDPKGELYRDTSEYLKSNGYTVRVFNVKDGEGMWHSDSWNPFKQFVDERGDPDIEAVLSFTRTFIRNTQGLGDTPFWGETAEQLMSALIFYSLVEQKAVYTNTDKSEEERKIEGNDVTSLGDLYVFLMTNGAEGLKKIFMDEKRVKPDSPTYTFGRGFAQNPANLLANIFTGLSQRLRHFTIPELKKITDTCEIDLSLPAREKCAYYIIINDIQNTYQFLTATFFTFLFKALEGYADKQADGQCPIPVNILLDEFANIGSIPQFDKVLTTARSRNVRVTVVVQSISQLEDMYPKEKVWKTIINSCYYMIVMGGGYDAEQLKYISEVLGTTGIITSGMRYEKETVLPFQLHKDYSENTGEGKRQLMTTDEIRRLEKGKLILVKQDDKPVKLDMFDYSKHPESENLREGHALSHYPEWALEDNLKAIIEDTDEAKRNVRSPETKREKVKQSIDEIDGDIEMLNAKREKTDIDYEKLRALNKRKEDLLVEYDVAEGEVIDKRKETYERTFMIYEALLRDMYDRQENLNVKLSEKRANQMYIEHPLSVTHGKQTAVDKILGRKVKDTDVCIGGRLPTGTFKPQVDYAMEEAIRREQFFIKKRQRQLEQIRKIGEDRYRDTNFHERIKTIEQAVYTEMKNRKAAISEMRKRRREYAEKQQHPFKAKPASQTKKTAPKRQAPKQQPKQRVPQRQPVRQEPPVDAEPVRRTAPTPLKPKHEIKPEFSRPKSQSATIVDVPVSKQTVVKDNRPAYDDTAQKTNRAKPVVSNEPVHPSEKPQPQKPDEPPVNDVRKEQGNAPVKEPDTKQNPNDGPYRVKNEPIDSAVHDAEAAAKKPVSKRKMRKEANRLNLDDE